MRAIARDRVLNMDTHPGLQTSTVGFLRGGGGLGALMRAKDWSATPLGPVESWPQSLRTSVSICLNSSFPILIWWGPELVKLYNDPYSTIIAEKHPRALGAPGHAIWPEIWDIVGPMLAQVMEHGEPMTGDDLKLIVNRRGYPEECYFSFSYTPIRDESGAIAGVFCPVIETTSRVFGQRRTQFLLELERSLRDIADPLAVKSQASALLGQHLGAQHVGYADISPNGEPLPIEGDWQDPSLPPISGRHHLPAFGQILMADLRQGRAVRVSNVSTDSRTGHGEELSTYQAASVASFIKVPLIKDGLLTAILFVRHSEPREWTELDVAAAQDVAERTWSAAERARTEAALRLSEGSFRALGENLPNLCWMAHADGSIYWYNKTWCDYAGRSLDHMIEHGWETMQDPRVLPAVEMMWKRCVATGTPFEMTFPLRGADGRYRPFLTRIVPVRDENGAITRWFGNNVDVSEIRAAEERLLTSEAELRQLNDKLEDLVAERTADRDRIWRLSTDIMLVARFDGPITAVNPAWTTVLGWTESEILGTSFVDLIHPDDLARSLNAAKRLSQGERLTQFETRFRHKNGEYRWITWAVVPGAGLINAVGRDMTAERRQAEALAHTEEQLRQAQRMEALGQLAGGIAHDFNNVLQAISGGLRLIHRRADDAAGVRKLVDMISDAAGRGASITSRLLAFARRDQLQAVKVQPRALLEGLREILAHTLGPRISVQIDLGPDQPAFLADKAQLETVLVNMAVNARDAMPDGGVLTLSAKLDQVDDPQEWPAGLRPGAYLRLALTDTGVGMDAATLARAGQPFFTTKPMGQGTGLGIAMARGFAVQSGGAFAISSAPAKGTTVKLWFPLAHTEDILAEPPSAAPPIALHTRARVLVVDDDALVRELLAANLEEIGYHTAQASDGLDALARLDAGEPADLLVTDFAMPGMGGLELIKEARRRRPDLPVLLLTGYADDKLRDQIGLMADHATVLLRKPITSDELAAHAASLLAARTLA